jgi:hypothetical protein
MMTSNRKTATGRTEAMMTSNRKLEAMDTEDVIRYIKDGSADVPRDESGGLDGWRDLYRHFYGDEGTLGEPE